MSVQTKETMVSWVRDHVDQSPTLSGLAMYVGYSPFYCSAKFREHTGMTYKQFLSACRLQAAAGDLSDTDDRVTDIAFRYGYRAAESLTRAFTAAYGCTPREYRISHRKNCQSS